MVAKSVFLALSEMSWRHDTGALVLSRGVRILRNVLSETEWPSLFVRPGYFESLFRRAGHSGYVSRRNMSKARLIALIDWAARQGSDMFSL
jgi:hypothetical protein